MEYFDVDLGAADVPEQLGDWVAEQLRNLGLSRVRVGRAAMPVRREDGSEAEEVFLAVQTRKNAMPLAVSMIAYSLETEGDRWAVIDEWWKHVVESSGV